VKFQRNSPPGAKNVLFVDFPTSIRLLTACLLLIASTCLNANTVTVEGRAIGDTAVSREQALTDALREAVRQGAGVNIAAQSQTQGFALDYDRVFAAAFGYVKDYKVIDSGIGSDGIYHVKMEAEVSPGAPDMNNAVALRQLVALKGSPRIALDIRENITGAPPESGYARAWFEEAAKNLQLNIVDVGIERTQERKFARRDEALGNTNSAEFRNKDITQKADFIIEGNVQGRYEGQQTIYGGNPKHVFGMSADLRAIRPETGEVVSSVVIHPSNNFDSDQGSPEMAAKDILFKLLNGGGSREQSGATVLFRKIFARWSSEFDLGRIVRVEMVKIDHPTLDAIQDKLKSECHVSAVRQREYDAQASTIIDVETRLNSTELTKAITNASGGTYSLDHGTENYLTFVKVNSGSNEKKSILGSIFGK
jgi:hypothetical protein